MGMFIFVIGFLTMVVSGIFFVLSLIKKKPLRNKIVIFMGGFLLLIGGALLTPAATPELHVDEAELVTNEQGEAAITGQTNPEAQLTINGVEVSLADETFSYTVQLQDEEEQEFSLQASMGGSTKEEVVTVKPSRAFLASLQAERQEQAALEKAETALALAESQPNQKNYDEAVTLIHALSKTYEDLATRLAVVEEHLAISKALDAAEASLERSDFDQAKELVAQAVLNKETFEGRLSTVETKISEKEAAAQAKAEEERQAAAAVPEQSQPAAASNQAQTSVLVTPTGSKYHTRKCGNGTYTPATLAEAQSRGLTPCAKCFP
ncbi:serine protease [Enterococcus casseliflavus]|uniref:serine protease n=1 Tax=Enterococcus casseliflavus TaxID=37734 RepID=UPI001918BBC4|nr:serine protease [Enterococcus casseliflavus]QQU21286.1 serine protease [Enterococcus casseliflavus]